MTHRGNQRENVRVQRKEEEIHLFIKPSSGFSHGSKCQAGELAMDQGVVKTEGQGCKLVPGDNSIIAKMLAK